MCIRDRSSLLQSIGLADPPGHVCCAVHVRGVVLGLKGAADVLVEGLVIIDLSVQHSLLGNPFKLDWVPLFALNPGSWNCCLMPRWVFLE